METISQLNKQILNCKICENNLPNKPRPIIQLSSKSKILIIGQAPGRLAHESNTPWNDPSGKKLRKWLNVSDKQFYDKNIFALLPMGFCFPGSSKQGDLKPRLECAPKWHKQVLEKLKHIELIILIGKFSQDYYLEDKLNLTQRIENQNYGKFIVFPHPSPRNLAWFKRNPFFESNQLPKLQKQIEKIISKN